MGFLPGSHSQSCRFRTEAIGHNDRTDSQWLPGDVLILATEWTRLSGSERQSCRQERLPDDTAPIVVTGAYH